MKFQEIKNNVFYCGLNDTERQIFDELIPLEHGTSYNSYLVKGSEKIAIIDTMYPPFTSEYIKNLKENGVNKVDYIIANHGEQDHSGSIPALLEEYPDAKVVTNATCKGNLMSMLFVPEEKIKSRYYKALDLIPELVEICDIVHIYDNTNVPFRIFKKRKDVYFHWENKYWSFSDIEKLTGIKDYEN